MSTVLVTGGSGFIASHTIIQLLGAGHLVRTTVRNLKRLYSGWEIEVVRDRTSPYRFFALVLVD